jgi:serine/threonine protein kinase
MLALDRFLTDIEDYDIGDIIGHEYFAVVHSGLRRGTGERVAIKRLETPRYTAQEAFFVRELLILAENRHPSTLHLLGFNIFGRGSGPVIITPFMPHGDLDRMITAEHSGTPLPGWSPTVKSKCIFGIAVGMSYLHCRKVMHRDLKPANVLFDETFETVIGGFCFARVVTERDFRRTIGIGTRLFMAPEVFIGDSPDGTIAYDFPVDVYSYGVLLYTMFSADAPPKSATGQVIRNQFETLRLIASGLRYEKPAKVTPFYWELIQRCWEHDWRNRPTFTEIIALLLDSHEYAIPGTDMRELVEYEQRITSFQS